MRVEKREFAREFSQLSCAGQTRLELMRVKKREFVREFSQLSCTGQTRSELMSADNSGCYPVTQTKLVILFNCTFVKLVNIKFCRLGLLIGPLCTILLSLQTGSSFATLINSHDWSNAHKLSSTLIKF